MHIYAFKAVWMRLNEAANAHGCSPSTLIRRADNGEVDRKDASDPRPPRCPCCRRTWEDEAPQRRLNSCIPNNKKRTLWQRVLDLFRG